MAQAPTPVPELPPATASIPVAFPYPVLLDSKFISLGEREDDQDPQTTAWTLPYADATLDKIVLSNQFGEQAGKVLDVTTIIGRKVRTTGDWSGGHVCIGRSYTSSLEMTRLYRRDSRNIAIVGDLVNIQKAVFKHINSYGHTIRVEQTSKASRSKVFLPAGGAKITQGQVVMWISGTAEDLQIFIENATPKPSTITAAEFRGRYYGGHI